MPVTILAYSLSQCVLLSYDTRFRRQGKMSSRFLNAAGAAAIAVMLALSMQTSSAHHVPMGAFSAGLPTRPGAVRRRRSGNADPAAGKPLRQLTGQNEELQFRNRRSKSGCASSAPRRRRRAASRRWRSPACRGAASSSIRASAAGLSAARNRSRGLASSRAIRKASPAMTSSTADRLARADRAGPGSPADRRPTPRRCLRSQPESQRPGAPRALGGGQMPMSSEAAAGAPGGRGPGEPLDMAVRAIPVAPCPAGCSRPPPRGPGRRQRRADHAAALGDVEGRIRSRHRLHAAQGLCAGRGTMKNFAQKYPSDPLIADPQYWLGEKLLPAPAISRRRRSVPRRDHQVRQVGQGARRPAAARPVAGGAEGKGSRLCGARRSDADIRAPRPASRPPSTVSKSGSVLGLAASTMVLLYWRPGSGEDSSLAHLQLSHLLDRGRHLATDISDRATWLRS